MKGEGVGSRGLIIGSVIFILVVGAIFFAITGGFFGGSDESVDNEARITDIFDGRSVRMTVEGPIVANEIRESYRITVGVNTRNIEAYKGYDFELVGSRQFSNNRAAYTDFVYALSRAGFNDKRRVSQSAADERGVCPKGKTYSFELLDDGRLLSRSWTTTCSDSRGTLDANGKILKDLFDRQIANRSQVLEGFSLR